MNTENISTEFAPVPSYKVEISTSAKGFHQFTVKAYGPDLDRALLEAKTAAATELKVFCDTQNEGVKV